MIRSFLAACLVAACLLVSWQPAGAADGKTHVLWLGQAAAKITTPGGKVIVIDPFLVKNPKTPAKYKDLSALGHVDLILVTHAHFDHVADAPALAKLNKAPMWGPPGMADTFVTLGVLPAELAPRMNKGGQAHPLGPDITITMVRAEHSSELKWVDPMTGKEQLFNGGQPCGWIITMENGFKLYHMGDTGLFGDMQLIADYYKPQLIMIPIGGHFVLSPVDAAYATNTWLKPKFAIPIHYATIPVLKGTPAEYMQALGSGSGTKVFPINPGDELTF